ncbi:MAG: K+/H+ antiporter subunit F [Burkholderiales bacterium]
MLDIAITLAAWMIAAALVLNVLRLVRGPDATDRVLALDTLYINLVGLIVLMCIDTGSKMYFEAAIVIALLGFIGTVALAKYILAGDIIE